MPQSRAMFEKLTIPPSLRAAAKKRAERGQVPHRAFGRDLLAQVVADVGVEQAPGLSALIDRRQIAVVHQPIQFEVGVQFIGHKPVKLIAQGAAAQQVRRASPHLAGAGPAESEAQTAVLDQPVNLVQERRHLLDFVDDDLPGRRRALGFDLLTQEFRPDGVAAVLVRLEQVDPSALRVGVPQQRALARLARAPEEETLRSGRRKLQASLEHAAQSIMMN